MEQELSPKYDTVPDRREEGVHVGVHGKDVLAVGVFFQRGVDPVHECVPLLLCGEGTHTGIS